MKETCGHQVPATVEALAPCILLWRLPRYPLFTEPVRLYATEHTLSVSFPDAYKAGFAHVGSVGEISQDAEVFQLRQMSFHAPGEHHFSGQATRLEARAPTTRSGRAPREGGAGARCSQSCGCEHLRTIPATSSVSFGTRLTKRYADRLQRFQNGWPSEVTCSEAAVEFSRARG